MTVKESRENFCDLLVSFPMLNKLHLIAMREYYFRMSSVFMHYVRILLSQAKTYMSSELLFLLIFLYTLNGSVLNLFMYLKWISFRKE